ARRAGSERAIMNTRKVRTNTKATTTLPDPRSASGARQLLRGRMIPSTSMAPLATFISVPGGRLWLSVDGPTDGPPLTLIHAGVATSEMYEGHVPAFVAAG